MHEGDHAEIEGVAVRSMPLLMTDPKATAEMVRAGLDLRAWRRDRSRNEHGTAAAIEILPVTGLPEFRPGDDLGCRGRRRRAVAARRRRRGGHQQGGVQVRGPAGTAPEDPEERDELRRKLVDDEAVRVLARKGRTLITENRLGLIQAAAGVDGSNVGRTELALLPVDPDGSAAALRSALRERLGVDVAVVITDTMGRAWRNGQIDAAVGAAGLAVLHGYSGAVDEHGNELVVTEIAVADEVAAAADLVKGKLTAMPVAVVRGLHRRRRRHHGPATAAIRRRRPVLARHRRSHRNGPPRRPSCCADRCAGSATSRCRRS